MRHNSRCTASVETETMLSTRRLDVLVEVCPQPPVRAARVRALASAPAAAATPGRLQLLIVDVSLVSQAS